MTAVVVVGVGLLGGVGAVARFLLDGAVASRAATAFPWGTLAVNLSGALALGILHGADVSGDALRLFGTGLLGAYTTFSTWMLESHRSVRRGACGWDGPMCSSASRSAWPACGSAIGSDARCDRRADADRGSPAGLRLVDPAVR